MDKQQIEETKKYIRESALSKEAKIQLVSLMDFINYPEVKDRVLKVLDVEEKLTDLEIKYLKEMNERFRNTDLFGYSKESITVNNQMKQNSNTKTENNTFQPQNSEPSTVATNNQVQPTTSSNPNIGSVPQPNINTQQVTV
jgi:hypothetical protein